MHLRSLGYDIYPKDFTGTWQTQYDEAPTIDIANYEEFADAVDEARPDLIIHLAARKGSDYVDQDVDDAIRSNVTGMMNVIAIANERLIPLIHFGTTAYYHSDEALELISETSLMAPKTVYGVTKMLQLQLLEAKCTVRHMVIEPVFLYGNVGPYAANRSESVPDLLVKLLNEDLDEVTVRIDPQWYKDYTHITDFVWLMGHIIERPAWGERVTIGAMYPARFALSSGPEMNQVGQRMIFQCETDYKKNQVHDYSKLKSLYPEWEQRDRIRLVDHYKARGYASGA